MSKKYTGKRQPVEYQTSFYCKIINKTVTLDMQELIDGYPLVTQWKKVKACNCNNICNPDSPTTFPRKCPAMKIQVSKI